MTRKPPSAVLFDCDGVIVDSEVLTNQVIRDDLATAGLDWTLEKVMDSFVGGTMKGVHTTARTAGADIADDWVEQIYVKIYAALEQSVEAVDGIAEVLDVLDAAKIPYGVGSNGRLVKMHLTLGRTGLLPRFEGKLYSAQDLANTKPAPDVYLKIAADLGVDPADCAVIEDSASGARAGRAAGMVVYGFAKDTAPAKLAPHCDVIFTDMSDFPALLGLG